MLRRQELSHDAHHTLIDHCGNSGIALLSTPLDLPSLNFLTRDPGLDQKKLG